jgi:parallel beta-helix repeat protein
LGALAASNVDSYMVLNEPQARTASSSENQFILDVIAAAKQTTSRPVSVRFMAGYSPSTGHYSTEIDKATDFLCRNSYWDPRQASTSVYGTTEAKMNGAISAAHTQGKEIWFTEFGKSKSNLESQRAYVEAFVSWAKGEGADRIFCWVSQPEGGSGEDYNIFTDYTPNPAFYELVNSAAYSSSTTTTTIQSSGAYTVFIQNSRFVAKAPSGSVLYNGTSAASAIQAAFSAVGTGQTVYISAGTYPISSQVKGSRSGVTVTGDKGAIIKASATMGYMFLWAGSETSHLTSFYLSNIVFDGGRTTSWPDISTNGLAAGPAIEYADHVVVDGITVQNTKRNPPTKGADGLILQGASGAPVSDYEIRNSRFTNIYGSGIAASYITKMNIHDNTFYDCAQWYPIGGAVYVGDEASYITVSKNHISGHADNDGIYLGTSRNPATNVLVFQNNISLLLYDKGGGDYDINNPDKYAGSGIKLYGTGGEISYNTVNWNNAHYPGWEVYTVGIGLWGTGTNAHHNTVSNTKYGIASWKGPDAGNHAISYNTVSACSHSCVYLAQSGCTVSNNVFSGCSPTVGYG